MPSVGMERSSNLVHHHYRMEHEEQRCECCPYGYHIDLDFVPFTKKMLSREGDVERLQELKDKWRSERTSMDKLLGVDAIAPKIWDVNATISRASTDVWRSVKAAFELEEAKKITRESHGTTGSNGGSAELIFENGLSEAVTDFEEALLRTRPQSKILSYEIPDTQKFHTFPRIKAPVLRDPVTGSSTLTAANLFSNRGSSSNTSTSVSTVIMKDSFAKFSSRELDKKSDDSLLEEMDSIYCLTSAPREREGTRDAAVRIRDMEEQLKRIPELEVKVTLLAEEKRQLMKLLEVEKQKVASARSLDSGDGSSPPAVPPRRRMRDACVGIAPITRDIGVSFISPRTRSIGVAVGCGSDSTQWDRMLRGESTSPTGSYTGTLKRRVLKIDEGVQVSDYQLADPKTEIPVLQIVERVDKAVQTMPGRQPEEERSPTSPLLKSKSLGTQVKPTVRDYGVSASQPEPVRSLRTSAVNTDKLRTTSIGCNTMVIREPTEYKPATTFSPRGLTKSTPHLERRLSSEEESGDTSRYSMRASPTRTRPSPTRVVEEVSEPIETPVTKSSLFSRVSPPRTFGATSPSSTLASVSTVSTTKISSSSTTTSSSIPRPASLSTVTALPETKIQSRIPRYQSSPLSSPVASGAKPVSSGIPSVSPDRSLSPMDASPLSSSSSSLSSAGSSSISSKPMYKRSDTYTKEINVPERQPLGLMRTLEPLEEEDREGPRSSSASSSSSGRPNALHSEGPSAERIKHTPSAEMQGALKVLNDALLRGKTTEQVTSAISVILHEWFRIAGTKSANAGQVEDYLDSFEVYSPQLLRYVVNMPDGNGNTALHYAVSHGNFDVVSILLDSKVCDPNKANKAGYTCIMLVALARIDNDAHRQVVRRLFSLGDVNIKAAQHGQTALMLGASHGRYDTVKLLIEAGADLNIQDEDGSTALMCAAEHGHIQIAQFLVCQPECDLQITDNDGSTAFTIAMEGGHKDVALILYAQVHCQPSASPTGSSNVHQRSRSTTPSSHASTSNSSSAHTSPIASVRRMNTS